MTTGAMAATAERALKWSAVTTVARFALQLAAQVALARMLGPGNFGVYGIGMAVLTFAAFLSSASFSWNLMLMPSVSRDDIRFSFTWQVIAGALTACAMYAAAPAIAGFFNDPRIEGMVQWLAVASLLGAASGPATCLLQRDLNFRVLGLIQLASYAAGYLAIGVPMALLGYGAYSLAAACVAQAVVNLLAVYVARPHSLRPLFAHSGGAAALVTGRAVFLTNVVNWLLGNLDRLVIGRVLSAHAVGLYHVAYNLAAIPNVLLLGALQPTFLAAGAKLQHDPQRLAQGWRLGLACILVLVTPAAVVMSLLSADLVGLLYGAAWMECAWVLGLLFLCLPAWACWGLSTPVLWNTNRKHREFLLQLPLLAAAVPLWWLFAPAGIRAVAIVSALVIVARAIVIVAAALNALNLGWAAILPYVARGAGLAVLCGSAAFAGQQAVASFGLPVISLSAGAGSALLALSILVGARPQVLGREAHGALSRLFPAFALRMPLPHTAALPAEPGGQAQ
jgi:O-antigen/teichoic acid export membrane protein